MAIFNDDTYVDNKLVLTEINANETLFLNNASSIQDYSLKNIFYADIKLGSNLGNSIKIFNNLALITANKNKFQSDTIKGKAYLVDINTNKVVNTILSPSEMSDGVESEFGTDCEISNKYIVISNKEINGTGEVYIFTIDGTYIETITDPVSLSGTPAFGSTLSLQGENLVITSSGTIGNDQVFIYNIASSTFTTFQEPTGIDTVDKAKISNGKIIIGCSNSSNNGIEQGKAYIYDLSGNLLYSLIDPSEANYNHFGKNVDISDNICVVYSEDSTDVSNGGRVHLYDVDTGNLLSTLIETTPTIDSYFGSSLSMFENRILVKDHLFTWDGSNTLLETTYILDNSDFSSFQSCSLSSNTAAIVSSENANISSNVICFFNIQRTYADDLKDSSYFLSRLTDLSDIKNSSYYHSEQHPDAGVTAQDIHFSERGIVANNDFYGVWSWGDYTGSTDGKFFLYDIKTNTLQNTYTAPTPTNYGGAFIGNCMDELLYLGDPQNPNGGTARGAIYVYDPTDPTTLLNTLYSNIPSDSEHFGGSKIIVKGELLIVGIPDFNGTFLDEGQVQIFDKKSLTHIRTISNPYPSVDQEYFGNNISISSNKIIISAEGATKDGNIDAGRVYVFNLDDGSLDYELISPQIDVTKYFGQSSIESNSDYICIGFDKYTGTLNNQGCVVIYDLKTGSQQQVIISTSPVTISYFGKGLSIQGNILVIGDPDLDDGSNFGRVVFYNLAALTKKSIELFALENYQTGFGQNIYYYNNLLFVGAYRDSTVGTETGKVHIYSTPTNDFENLINKSFGN